MHDRSAHQYPYPHNRRANKVSYPHDRSVTDDLCKLCFAFIMVNFSTFYIMCFIVRPKKHVLFSETRLTLLFCPQLKFFSPQFAFGKNRQSP